MHFGRQWINKNVHKCLEENYLCSKWIQKSKENKSYHTYGQLKTTSKY